MGQVLAMLYVILNADMPQAILIDEPQSFLHPGAIRKFLEILKENPQHQYILATHSPTVISAANPSTITLIRQQDGVSDFYPIDPNENNQLRQYLAEIGASLSDVFGADNILWVEGPTEEMCFPLILSKVAKRALMGTAIVAVAHTGDFDQRNAKTIKAVFKIYERLSKGRGLLPPAVGFIFDKEERSEKDQADIKEKSNNAFAFTKCRLYENYLLNPRAISEIVNGIENFRNTPTTEAEISKWIAEEVRRWSEDKSPEDVKKYGRPAQPWKEHIHGAHLLEKLFTTLSETRVTYEKTTHSVALTEWLAENAPEDLAEIAKLITEVLDSPQANLAQASAS